MDKEQFYKEFFRYLECGSCADLEFCQKQLEPACKTGLAIYRKLKMEDLEKENEQLKKQCQECKHLNKKIELNIKNKLMNEVDQLKQLNESLTKRLDDRCDICIEREKQSQNQTAIKELEKMKEIVLKEVERVEEIYTDGFQSGFNCCYVFMEKQIDQQIKELKGESTND